MASVFVMIFIMNGLYHSVSSYVTQPDVHSAEDGSLLQGQHAMNDSSFLLK